MAPTGMPKYFYFHANRPFLYIISEQSTGAIFFIGQFTGGIKAQANSITAIKQDQSKAALYNLSGQRLDKAPAHGLYIQNGKKILR
jgi:hypothetical protein